MASIVNLPDGSRRVSFFDAHSERRYVRLGKVPRKSAETAKAHIEHIVKTRMLGVSIDPETTAWLAKLDDRMYARFAAVGLVPPRIVEPAVPAVPAPTLQAILDRYKAARVDLQESTQITHENVRRNLIAYFGGEKPVTEITVADAKDWRAYLAGTLKLGRNTVAKRSGIAKQFFDSAVEREVLAKNPFKNLPSTVRESDRARDYFITTEEATTILEACPSAEWRLVFALSRYGGLRCPSEHFGLRWDDINWDAGKMLVRSPKTKHHPQGDSRMVPLFPELRPYLDECWERAEEGAEFVIVGYRDAKQNLRTQLTKIIIRAGVKPWPKLFHNLRASRETELNESFPTHVVCEWIGNSPQVAMRHYLRVNDGHFAAASAEKLSSGKKLSSKKAHQKAHQKPPETVRSAPKPVHYADKKTLENQCFSRKDYCTEWSLLDSNQ